MSTIFRSDVKPWSPRNNPNAVSLQKVPSVFVPQRLIAASPEQNSTVQLSPTAAKLFVGQLPFETDELRLYKLFSAYGNVEHIHILRDLKNRSKGAAFVTYSNVEEADTAIFTLHNRYKMLANRMIQVSYAKNSPNISPFGSYTALAVHQMNPTNPLPGVANRPPEIRAVSVVKLWVL
ncbi:hypothetical protein TcYC6_0014820 [Trypanosoma cruzi]|nr:hypothetical protein TcYC6_0014820 [Trypanosoma cruzi]